MYILHGVNDWGSLVVHLALEELGVNYEFKTVDYKKGTLASLSYRALNPLGLVPVLETPQGPIFETAAILLYLAEAHHALAPQVGTSDRPAFLSWFAFVTNGLHPTVMALFHPERPLGAAHQVAVSEASFTRMRSQLDQLEAHMPLAPSILTLYVAMLLRWAICGSAYRHHTLDISVYPKLALMLRDLEERPAVARVLLREGLGPQGLSQPVYVGADFTG
jgi:glutathione S-transferase